MASLAVVMVAIGLVILIGLVIFNVVACRAPVRINAIKPRLRNLEGYKDMIPKNPPPCHCPICSVKRMVDRG